MQTNATTVLHMGGPAPHGAGALRARRALRLVLFGILALSLAGERGARTQTVGGINLGVDPLRVLDLQLKPNVIFVLDSSGSMQQPPGQNTSVVGDDTASKLYQAKQAVNAVLTANAGKFNFGLATYNVLNASKRLLDNNGSKPLWYVTTSSEPGVAIWTGSGTTYFSGSPGTPYLYTDSNNGGNDAQVWRSFARFNGSITGPGCATGVNCRRYLHSRLFRSGLKFRWNTTATGATGNPPNIGTDDILKSITPIDCSTLPPPAGMFPDDPPGMVRPCIQMQNDYNDGQANQRKTTFWYNGADWTFTGNACGGGAILDNVAACGVDNVAAIQRRLQLELPMWDFRDPAAATNTCGGARGTPCGLTPATVGTTATAIAGNNPATMAGLNANDVLGVIAGQNTPLGGTLSDILTNFNTVFPNPGGTLGAQQKNFVIFLTDGAETCTTNAPVQASALWNRGGHAGGQWAETIVIGFSLIAADQASLNAIACAGSGGTVSNPTCTGSFCTATCTGGLRRTAFSAASVDELIRALEAALSESTTTGQFSASPSQVASVFEYVGGVSGMDPRDPTTRYKFDLPVLFQPSFEVPGFKGRLRAFKSDLGTPPSSVQVWEAGQKLLDRVVTAPGALGNPVPWTISPTTNKYTFDQLHAAATPANVAASSARIKRRILTTRRNGVNPPIDALWPPDATVAPAVQSAGVNDLPGILDVALGITYPAEPDDAARFAKLQADFGACTGLNVPLDCLSLNATLRYSEARREAREMILAWTAGARAVRDDANLIQRNSSQRVLFEARSCGNLADPACPGILGESTNSTPAVIGQAPDSPPENNAGEKNAWLLLRDGPRTAAGDAINGVDQGFGLNSPDADGKEKPPNSTGTFRVSLKPAMDVVYYGGNDMLHAFRAGPQCTAPTGACPSSGDESGGEELWGFVPFDQLDKLAQLMTPRGRNSRIYMIASSLRFGRVFVPGTFTIGTTTYTGRWRTVLLFGRGPGGKHYTALDVTTAGAFTRASLNAILPSVLWNRGNPDTDNGQPKNAGNAYNGSASDYTAYLGMGLTFSVPGLGRVTRSSANNNVEFIAYTGSGYSDQPNEGRRIYALNLRTGEVIHSFDPGDATTDPQYPRNAVVAGPSVFIPTQLETAAVGNPYGELATRVFVPDLHGRVWRFDTEDWNATSASAPFFDFGPDNPIGVPLALLNYKNTAAGDTVNRAYIFGETGEDRRTQPPPAFKLFALRERDDGTAERAFPDVTLPVEPTSSTDPTPVYFRGTAQPATIFNRNGFGRVFYLATVFKPCVDPPFESAIYALTAATGEAAYDLNDGDDKRVDVPDLLLTTPIITKQGLVTSGGLAVDTPPPPPGGPTQTTGTSGPNAKVLLAKDPSGATATVRIGSSACR
jgi:hypothetical protein